jgi:hypothetical protein
MSAQRLISVSGFFAALMFVSLLPNRIPPAAGAEPTAIVLLYFRGSGMNNAVFLEWATATEFETAGFRLERSQNENGPYLPLDNIGFIPAEGLGLEGAEYEAIDDTAVNGQLYWYKLVEIEWGGTQNRSDPITVMAGIATPTATATHTPAATPSRTPTHTPVPTATTASISWPPPTATASATPTAVSTAAPTATATPAALLSSPTATVTAVSGPATVQPGPTRPPLTPTRAGDSHNPLPPPATVVAESGSPVPQAGGLADGEGQAPVDPLGLPTASAPAATSRVIEQVVAAPPPVDLADLALIGSSGRNGSSAVETTEGLPAVTVAGAGDRSFTWFAWATALFVVMAGTVAVAFFFRSRRYERNDRW